MARAPARNISLDLMIAPHQTVDLARVVSIPDRPRAEHPRCIAEIYQNARYASDGSLKWSWRPTMCADMYLLVSTG